MSNTLNSDNLNGNITSSENLSGTLNSSGTLSGEISLASGGTGTNNYNDLSNKPQINNVTLSGNKTTADLGLFSGNYNDLTNKPTIPAAQVNSDWNSSSGVSEILNKPMVPSVLRDLSDVNVPASAPSGTVFLGRAEGQTTWDQFVPSLILNLNDFSDIAIFSPVNGQALIYNNGYWRNESYNYNNLTNKPNLATVATSGDYNDLTNKPLFSVITRSKTMSLAAGASGYFQLDDVLDFPASNSYLIGFFGYAALTYATRGTIMSAGLIENGAKPYIHYQVGEAGFTDVPFYFRFVFYTP